MRCGDVLEDAHPSAVAGHRVAVGDRAIPHPHLAAVRMDEPEAQLIGRSRRRAPCELCTHAVDVVGVDRAQPTLPGFEVELRRVAQHLLHVRADVERPRNGGIPGVHVDHHRQVFHDGAERQREPAPGPDPLVHPWPRRVRRAEAAGKGSQPLDSRAMTDKLPVKVYEHELARLQEELVKMEEWVYAVGARIAIVFEGRDAAGKGGAIKRMTEHMNPRDHQARRVAETDRARDIPVVLPALCRAPARRRRDRAVRPLLVQPRRRRARARLLHAPGLPAVPAPMPDLRAAARGGRRHPVEVLVLGVRRGAGAAVPQADRRSDAPVEAFRDRPVRPDEVGRLLTREGRHVRAHRHPRRHRGTSWMPTTSAAPGSTAWRTCCRRCRGNRARSRRSSCRRGSPTWATCVRRWTCTPTCRITPRRSSSRT